MSRSVKIVISVIVLAIAGYVVWGQLGRWYGKRMERALEQEKEGQQKRIEELEEQVGFLEEELDQQASKLIDKEKLTEIFGKETTEAPPEAKEIRCEDIKRGCTAFFNHLDKQPYVQSYGIKEGSEEFFKQLLLQLSEAPPRVSGEMVELPSLMSNMAHFYRVLGKKRVDLLREILTNESDIMESVVATLYQWAAVCDRCDEKKGACPSLKTLYEYAGFFLNTLGGRSYLMRRNAQLRVLGGYYALLVLDRANDATLNRYGIDIRPHLETTLSEIRSTKGFMHRKQYLETLNALKLKYNY